MEEPQAFAPRIISLTSLSSSPPLSPPPSPTPFPSLQCLSSCSFPLTAPQQSPTGNAAIDAAVGNFARQLAATATDPNLLTWFTNEGKEGPDVCAGYYGQVFTGQGDAQANVLGANGAKFLLPALLNPDTGRCITNLPSVRDRSSSSSSSSASLPSGTASSSSLPSSLPSLPKPDSLSSFKRPRAKQSLAAVTERVRAAFDSNLRRASGAGNTLSGSGLNPGDPDCPTEPAPVVVDTIGPGGAVTLSEETAQKLQRKGLLKKVAEKFKVAVRGRGKLGGGGGAAGGASGMGGGGSGRQWSRKAMGLEGGAVADADAGASGSERSEHPAAATAAVAGDWVAQQHYRQMMEDVTARMNAAWEQEMQIARTIAVLEGREDGGRRQLGEQTSTSTSPIPVSGANPGDPGAESEPAPVSTVIIDENGNVVPADKVGRNLGEVVDAAEKLRAQWEQELSGVAQGGAAAAAVSASDNDDPSTFRHGGVEGAEYAAEKNQKMPVGAAAVKGEDNGADGGAGSKVTLLGANTDEVEGLIAKHEGQIELLDDGGAAGGVSTGAKKASSSSGTGGLSIEKTAENVWERVKDALTKKGEDLEHVSFDNNYLGADGNLDWIQGNGARGMAKIGKVEGEVVAAVQEVSFQPYLGAGGNLDWMEGHVAP